MKTNWLHPLNSEFSCPIQLLNDIESNADKQLFFLVINMNTVDLLSHLVNKPMLLIRHILSFR